MSYYITKTTTKSGIARINDGADEVPLKSWEVEITPKNLSGKSEVICTRTGKNIMPPVNGDEWEDGGIDSRGQNISDTNARRTKGYILIKDPDDANYLCLKLSGYTNSGNKNQIKIYFYDENKNYKANSSLNNDNEYLLYGTSYIRMVYYTNTITWQNEQLEYLPRHDAPTEYAPYINPISSTVNLGQAIHGGYVNVINGTGTKVAQKLKIGDLDWTYQSENNLFCTESLASTIAKPAQNWEVAPFLYSDIFTPEMFLVVRWTDKTIGVDTSGNVFINDMTYSDVTTFLQAYSDTYIIVGKATPEPFTFTPISPIPETVKNCNFFTDAHDSVVEYYCKVESEALYTVTDTTLKNIADAIRTKTERTAPILVEDMDDEILSIITGGGGEAERLCYLKCYNNDQREIPQKAQLVEDAKYSQYLSYDTSTKKFNVLQDFTAILVGWVYTYQTYESSISDGSLYVNDHMLGQYEANGHAAGSKGGAYFIWPVKQGDTIYPYTPTRDGYPQQNMKIYLAPDQADGVWAFEDEEA